MSWIIVLGLQVDTRQLLTYLVLQFVGCEILKLENVYTHAFWKLKSFLYLNMCVYILLTSDVNVTLPCTSACAIWR